MFPVVLDPICVSSVRKWWTFRLASADIGLLAFFHVEIWNVKTLVSTLWVAVMKLGGHGRYCEARNEAPELKRTRNWICIDGTAKTIREVPLISGFGCVV